MSSGDHDADARRQDRRAAVREFSEDLTGFGGPELRTVRDLYLRPARVLSAYEEGAPDLGGYAKPFRLFLGVNGAYLLLLALTGGFGRTLSAFPPEIVALIARASGKSPIALGNDIDKWYSLVSVPVIALAFFFPLYWVFRRWSGGGPRSGFRQTFAFLTAWTLYGAPFGLAVLWFPQLAPISAVTLPLVFGLLWTRLGRGRWWRTAGGFVGRGLILFLISFFCVLLGGLLAGALVAGAVFLLP